MTLFEGHYGLGPAEAKVHESLHGAAREVQQLLEGLRQSPAVPAKLQMSRIDRQIKELQAQMREHIRDLELMAEEQDTEEEAQAVEACVRVHKATYESLRHAITNMQLLMRQRTEATFAQQRKELLSGASATALRRQYQQESDVVEGAQAVTQGLTTAIRELEQTLAQQEDTKELLDTGNTVLSQTTGVLQDQKQLFKESDKKLKTLKRQASGDRWLLYMGLILFLTVAGYIAYKRAPAPIKMPIDAALGLAGTGVSFAARQAGAGLHFVWQQAQDKMASKKHGSDEGGGEQGRASDHHPWVPPPSPHTPHTSDDHHTPSPAWKEPSSMQHHDGPGRVPKPSGGQRQDTATPAATDDLTADTRRSDQQRSEWGDDDEQLSNLTGSEEVGAADSLWVPLKVANGTAKGNASAVGMDTAGGAAVVPGFGFSADNGTAAAVEPSSGEGPGRGSGDKASAGSEDPWDTASAGSEVPGDDAEQLGVDGVLPDDTKAELEEEGEQGGSAGRDQEEEEGSAGGRPSKVGSEGSGEGLDEGEVDDLRAGRKLDQKQGEGDGEQAEELQEREGEEGQSRRWDDKQGSVRKGEEGEEQGGPSDEGFDRPDDLSKDQEARQEEQEEEKKKKKEAAAAAAAAASDQGADAAAPSTPDGASGVELGEYAEAEAPPKPSLHPEDSVKGSPGRTPDARPGRGPRFAPERGPGATPGTGPRGARDRHPAAMAPGPRGDRGRGAPPAAPAPAPAPAPEPEGDSSLDDVTLAVQRMMKEAMGDLGGLPADPNALLEAAAGAGLPSMAGKGSADAGAESSEDEAGVDSVGDGAAPASGDDYVKEKEEPQKEEEEVEGGSPGAGSVKGSGLGADRKGTKNGPSGAAGRDVGGAGAGALGQAKAAGGLGPGGPVDVALRHAAAAIRRKAAGLGAEEALDREAAAGEGADEEGEAEGGKGEAQAGKAKAADLEEDNEGALQGGDGDVDSDGEVKRGSTGEEVVEPSEGLQEGDAEEGAADTSVPKAKPDQAPKLGARQSKVEPEQADEEEGASTGPAGAASREAAESASEGLASEAVVHGPAGAAVRQAESVIRGMAAGAALELPVDGELAGRAGSLGRGRVVVERPAAAALKEAESQIADMVTEGGVGDPQGAAGGAAAERELASGGAAGRGGLTGPADAALEEAQALIRDRQARGVLPAAAALREAERLIRELGAQEQGPEDAEEQEAESDLGGEEAGAMQADGVGKDSADTLRHSSVESEDGDDVKGQQSSEGTEKEHDGEATSDLKRSSANGGEGAAPSAPADAPSDDAADAPADAPMLTEGLTSGSDQLHPRDDVEPADDVPSSDEALSVGGTHLDEGDHEAPLHGLDGGPVAAALAEASERIRALGRLEEAAGAGSDGDGEGDGGAEGAGSDGEGARASALERASEAVQDELLTEAETGADVEREAEAGAEVGPITAGEADAAAPKEEASKAVSVTDEALTEAQVEPKAEADAESDAGAEAGAEAETGAEMEAAVGAEAEAKADKAGEAVTAGKAKATSASLFQDSAAQCTEPVAGSREEPTCDVESSGASLLHSAAPTTGDGVTTAVRGDDAAEGPALDPEAEGEHPGQEAEGKRPGESAARSGSMRAEAEPELTLVTGDGGTDLADGAAPPERLLVQEGAGASGAPASGAGVAHEAWEEVDAAFRQWLEGGEAADAAADPGVEPAELEGSDASALLGVEQEDQVVVQDDEADVGGRETREQEPLEAVASSSEALGLDEQSRDQGSEEGSEGAVSEKSIGVAEQEDGGSSDQGQDFATAWEAALQQHDEL